MSDNIERASMLLDVVQKIASVVPAYTALSSVAMMELKEMNESAQQHINELGQKRLREEQEAAAELEQKRLADEPEPKVFVPPPADEPVVRRV